MEARKTFKVATLPLKHVFEVVNDTNGRTGFAGFKGLFMDIVMDALGISYEVVLPADGQFGHKQPNGIFTGMIGMVQNEEADMAYNILRMSNERWEVVDYSRPYTMEGLDFVSKKPGNIVPIFGFLYPFDVHIWVSILITLIVLSTMTKILDRSSIWGHNFFRTVSSFLKQQPLEMGNGSLKWRFLIGFWSFFTLVVSSCYSSALLAFLTVPLHGKAIENFHQLSQAVQKGTHKCYILRGSIQTPVLQTSSYETKILHDIAVKNNWYYDFSDIGNDKFVDIDSMKVDSTLVLKLFFGFRKEKYLISKEAIAVTPVAIVLSRNFCCKAKLNTILSRIEGSGIYNKLLEDASLKVSLGKSGGIEEDSFKPLALRDLYGCLMILVVGWTLSFLVLAGELIVSAVCKRKNCKIKKVLHPPNRYL